MCGLNVQLRHISCYTLPGKIARDQKGALIPLRSMSLNHLDRPQLLTIRGCASQGDLARLSLIVSQIVRVTGFTFPLLKFGLRNEGNVFDTVAWTVSLVMML